MLSYIQGFTNVTGDRKIGIDKGNYNEQVNGNYSEQKSNFDIGDVNGSVVKDNAKVANKLEENNNNQSQDIKNEVTINLNSQNKSNLSNDESDTVNNHKKIKASVKQGDIEYSAEAPTVQEVIECFKSLKELFDVEVKDIEIRRRAIFEDAPGDRSKVLSRA